MPNRNKDALNSCFSQAGFFLMRGTDLYYQFLKYQFLNAGLNYPVISLI